MVQLSHNGSAPERLPMNRYTLPGESPRRRPNRPLRIAVASAAVLFALGLGWTALLPRLLIARVGEIAELRATVGSASFNPFTGVLRIADLQLASPQGFAPGDALNLRRLEAEVRLSSLLTQTAQIERMEVEIEACTVATDANDAFNWGVIASRLRSATSRPPPLELAPLGLVRSRNANVRDFHLALNRLRIVDGGRQPARIAHFTIGLEDRIESTSGVRGLAESAGLAALAATARTALETDNRESVRILNRVARDLGARSRNRDVVVDNLLDQVWPAEATN